MLIRWALTRNCFETIQRWQNNTVKQFTIVIRCTRVSQEWQAVVILTSWRKQYLFYDTYKVKSFNLIPNMHKIKMSWHCALFIYFYSNLCSISFFPHCSVFLRLKFSAPTENLNFWVSSCLTKCNQGQKKRKDIFKIMLF